MNKKSLRVLEFDKIIKRLESRAVSFAGKELAAELLPLNDIHEINRAQDETAEAASLILRKGALPLGGMRDMRESLKRARAGGSLSIAELLAASDFIHVCGKIIKYHKNEGLTAIPGNPGGQAYPVLDPLFAAVNAPIALEKELNRCITNEQEISDGASEKLSGIRKGISTANNRIRDALNGIIHSAAYKNMLQDTIITIRGDRYCVPVKFEYRSAFPGMVHDQSSSGSTVFIEPLSVVQLNNKIKELRADEKNEIDKILRRLSGEIAEESEPLEDNIKLLANLDFAFAKGELALNMRAGRPVYNERGRIHIKKGRHPLLDESAVPIDMRLGAEFNMLVITGPNTGGKTVALKTMGLFCLMGQAGLHIPAENSELSIFKVFADIGDEQSIEQNLSTFSSHMKNIVEILSSIGPDALVLLDELGAGTDPTEGAALAAAVLDHLREKKIRAAVTTHYSELKIYALSTNGAENASCEFDVETLMPTYKLLTGVPGKSNAFAISRKLGLSEEIITAAREIISHENARFEDIITDLEISKKNIDREQERAEEYRREAEKLKREFEKQKEKLDENRSKILREARNEARDLTRAAKDEADRLLKEYQKSLRENDRHNSEAARKKLRDSAAAMDDLAARGEEKKELRPLPKHLKNGDRVFIRTIGRSGSIISPPDANGDVMAQAGIMKVKVHISNLSLDETKEKEKPKPVFSARSAKASASAGITASCDLRGMTVEEGVDKADKYLDAAFLSGLPQVTVIHGKGTGALRSAIRNMLKNRPGVKSYRPGQYGEGGEGVTMVDLN